MKKVPTRMDERCINILGWFLNLIEKSHAFWRDLFFEDPKHICENVNEIKIQIDNKKRYVLFFNSLFLDFIKVIERIAQENKNSDIGHG